MNIITKKMILYTMLIANSTTQLLSNTTENDTHKKYFDTDFLTKYDEVQNALITDFGAKKITLQTEDNHTLNGLFIKRDNAVRNVILCSGFYPGRKEGLATYCCLFPTDYNILLFDARGHGESTGPFASSLWYYGQNEYKDIIAAAQYLKTHTQCDTIIHGTCSGAFHAVHALYNLNQEKLDQLRIKGLVFDSGWASISETSVSAIKGQIQEMLLSFFLRGYSPIPHKMDETDKRKMKSNRKKKIKQSYFYRFCSQMSASMYYLFNLLLFKVPIYFTNNEHKTNLFDKIQAIQIPILFIHSEDDHLQPIDTVKKLADPCSNKECWWITQPSKHACHNLKHSDQYKEKLTRWLESLNHCNILPS